MMRNTATYSVLAAACLLAFLSCQREQPLPAPRTPIELTAGIVGDSSPLTKGVTTDSPYGTAATAFGAATNLYMVLKGEKTSATPLYSRTMGSVTASEAAVSFGSAYTRFWEDCYSRDSKLSVFAACVPGKATALTIGSSADYSNNVFAWSSTEVATTIAWPLSGTSADQTAEGFLDNQDLCFSNNVSGNNGITFNTGTKKFGNGNMVFHHALTWITFKIKKGAGFETQSFAFSNSDENIVLKGFNTSGTLTIATGEFSNISTAQINKLAAGTPETGYAYILHGYMLPGSVLAGTETDQIYFTIDNNKYHITKKQLQDALSGKTLTNNSLSALPSDNKMRPGVHYVFEFTVSKKGIDKISATVVDWETVTADVFTPSNARITVSLLDNNSHITTGGANDGVANFDLFRSAVTSETIDDSFTNYSWGTGYVTQKARLVENATEGEFTAQEPDSPYTEWYWPDNKTFYHFRTVYPKTDTDWKVESEETAGADDYITLARGASFKDVCWGAPFNALVANAKLTYSLTSGFDNTTGTAPSQTHQISKAIGPTNGAISMTLFHMMSDVTIQLTTTTGDDKVTLEGATIQLSNTYPSGKVRMGNGLVEPDGTPDVAQATVVETSGNYKVEHFGFIPQTLENVGGVDEKDVVLTITTSDNNEYRVNMKGMKATTIGNNLISNPYTISDGKYTINRWYPNYQYTYTFHLTKTGIAKITATLANWETVSADNENIQIQ